MIIFIKICQILHINWREYFGESTGSEQGQTVDVIDVNPSLKKGAMVQL